MPPQPAGVWNSVYNYAKWIDATGLGYLLVRLI
jgi:hypothetical protein